METTNTETAAAHNVIGRREVPCSVRLVGNLTGKAVTETPVHAGQKAVCVELATGFRAWGFGATWEAAESDAVRVAMEICQ